MTYVGGFSTFLFLFALAAGPTFVLTLCPENCNCRGDNNEFVECTGFAELPVLQGEIRAISITDGNISAIPDGYFNISSLLSVDLSNNRLTTLNMESFEYTSSISSITLTGNDIVCDENIDWLAMWMASYYENAVVGTCAGTGATIGDYLSDKPSQLYDTSFGTTEDLRFGSACEKLSIHLLIDAPATAPLTYMITFTPGDPSTADHLQLVNSEVTIPTGATSTVIQFRVVNQGSGQDRAYSLTVTPKYFTAEFMVIKMHLVNGDVPCTSGEPTTTAAPSESPASTTRPRGTTAEPTTMSKPPGGKPSGPSPVAKAFIAIAVIIAVGAAIAFLVYMCFCKEDKTTQPKQPDVAYSPVSDKVYNPTTTNDV